MNCHSCDTNILFFSLNPDCPEHSRATAYLRGMENQDDFLLCELVLVELYELLRNPTINTTPLSASAASAVIQIYRRNPRWRLVDYTGYKMDAIWDLASSANFPRRAIYDARLALTLRQYGVTHFATRNTKHFQEFGFDQVFDPSAASQ